VKNAKRMLWERKWWWITPIVILVTLYAVVILTADRTGDSPFVYNLF